MPVDNEKPRPSFAGSRLKTCFDRLAGYACHRPTIGNVSIPDHFSDNSASLGLDWYILSLINVRWIIVGLNVGLTIWFYL